MTALRPITSADVEALERQHVSAVDAGEFGWFGFRSPGHFRRRFEADELITEERGNLAIADDTGSFCGDVSWIRVFNGPPPNGFCWNIGVWLLPEHRGEGHGSAAQRQLAAYLFEHSYLERVEASTEADNVPGQRALQKAGFTREGVLRRACFRGGAWRDMVLFSKIRGEP